MKSKTSEAHLLQEKILKLCHLVGISLMAHHLSELVVDLVYLLEVALHIFEHVVPCVNC